MSELTLRPMTDAEYDAFYSKLITEYAAVNVEAGNWLEEDALDLSKKAIEALLPHGRETPRVLLLSADNSNGKYVGYIWIGLDHVGSNTGAWIYDIEVTESMRGKGYGRDLLRVAEEEIVKNGIHNVGLNVFGSNRIARNLYKSSGYETTQIAMSKKLS